MSKKQQPAVQISDSSRLSLQRPAAGQSPNLNGNKGLQQRQQSFSNPNLSKRPPRRPGGR